MTARPTMDLADYIRELTETHSHAEHYQIRRGRTWYGANHVTKVPPLIAQLWANDLPSQATESGTRPGFGSKPAARLDALDTAARIDIEAHRWVTDLGEPPRGIDTIDLVRQLHGLSASAAGITRGAITKDVRSWWTQARIVTGWDSPAWAPDNTCPQCGERGTLKVRLGDQLGMCTNDVCRVTWDSATIGLLADHIRAESEAARVPVLRPMACRLQPDAVVPDLSVLCPTCGSARCVRALMMRMLEDVRHTESATG
jgi:hypothetical protein